MKRRFAVALLSAVALATPIASYASGPYPISEPASEQTLATVVMAETNAIAHSYVVYLRDDAARVNTKELSSLSSTVTASIKQLGGKNVSELSAVGAVLAELTDDQVEQLRKNPHVLQIAQDSTFSKKEIAQTKNSPSVDLAQIKAIRSWGIDRIDQTSLPLDGRYNAPATGKGVTAFIMDTGINSHQDFSGRLGSGTDIVDNDNDPGDCNSHGTHVAGTVGGNTAGVARDVTLRAVRVMDCDGNGKSSNIVKAVDWMLKQNALPAVANNSVGGDDKQQTEVEAIKRLGKGGVFMGIASGNDDEDTCKGYYKNSIIDSAMVSSSTKRDARASSSNYGRCNHIFAPGEDIISTSNSSNTGFTTKSGTSMAAPHVTGAGALYLEKNPKATPRQVLDALVANAVSDKISDVKGTPNKLLNVSFISGIKDPTKPSTTKPATTKPGTTKPSTTKPASTKPATTKPATSKPPTDDPGDDEFSNTTVQQINDYRTVTSEINSTKSGANRVTVTITIKHTCSQNLEINLISPDGSRNRLKSAQYGQCTAWDGPKTSGYPVSSESAGTWKLEVADRYYGNTGTLNEWKIKFS